MEQAPPLIVTLKLDAATFEQVNALRQQHFPAAKNFLPAHVTLFHQLPHPHEIGISQTLQTLCAQTAPIPLQLPNLRFLGRGVAIAVLAPALIGLRQTLATHWQDWLTKQDRQPYQPHITIQNKVTPETARQRYAQLQESWQPQQGYGEGLQLWYYYGGPWKLAQEFFFLPQCHQLDR